MKHFHPKPIHMETLGVQLDPQPRTARKMKVDFTGVIAEINDSSEQVSNLISEMYLGRQTRSGESTVGYRRDMFYFFFQGLATGAVFGFTSETGLCDFVRLPEAVSFWDVFSS